MDHASHPERDPVCGMKIDPRKAAATREHEGRKYFFCSPGCAKQFDADAHRFAHAEPGASHSH